MPLLWHPKAAAGLARHVLIHPTWFPQGSYTGITTSFQGCAVNAPLDSSRGGWNTPAGTGATVLAAKMGSGAQMLAGWATLNQVSEAPSRARPQFRQGPRESCGWVAEPAVCLKLVHFSAPRCPGTSSSLSTAFPNGQDSLLTPDPQPFLRCPHSMRPFSMDPRCSCSS